MSSDGGPPRGRASEDAILAKLDRTLNVLDEERKARIRLEEQVGELLAREQTRERSAPQPQAVAAPAAGDVTSILLASVMDTNKILMQNTLNARSEPAPQGRSLDDPAIKELIDSRVELAEMRAELRAMRDRPASSAGSGGGPPDKLSKWADRLIDEHLDSILEGGRATEKDDGGVLEKLLDKVIESDSLDTVMEAAAERIRGGKGKGDSDDQSERRERRKPRRPNVDAPANKNKGRSLPKEPPKETHHSEEDEEEGESLHPSEVESGEDLLVAVATALRDGMPADEFVAELPAQAKVLLRQFPEAQLISMLRSSGIPLLKSTRARQWVQEALKLL